ncbi:hypothetical protein H2199_003842 [Coniosporium tulheliwenetii]|uniref:Uncharacterized protein n=1 Tax=Coniosporium tulheliwenetii TaxID=3383036 RepID=A0ACC2Z883_9PEZI|nr:hypothetical protein H2199_003842 [Cladosporium sp. JES 115]
MPTGGEVHVTKWESIGSEASGAQTEGMIRQNAIVGLSDQLCGTDTLIYAARGYGTIVSAGGSKRQDLAPGDFALIPAWTEHQEVNDGDEEVLWIICRGGREPIVENLEGWGKS